MNVFELMWFVLILAGAVCGGIFGYAHLGGWAALLLGVPLGGGIGFLAAATIAFLLAVIFKAMSQSPSIMHRRLSTVLTAAMLFGLVNAISADAKEPEPAQQTERIEFPYFVPDSRIVLGKELVDEVNALASKADQIQFLLKILPPKDQKRKRLSERQLYAIRLLSLTDSDVVIDPLLDRFEFAHTSDGWPVVHALARLGERAVEPVVKKLKTVGTDRQKAATLGAALIEIKDKEFPMFIEELKRRKDVKLPEELLNELLDQYLFAPND